MLAIVFLSKTIALVTIAMPDVSTALLPAARAEGHETAAKHTKPEAKAEPKAEPNDAPAEPAVAREPPEPPGPPPISDSEKAVLLELRQRRQELEAREATIASRESLVTAAEQKLSSRVEELRELQRKLESLDDTRQQQDEAAWKGLVKVYETMKPRDAGTIFNDLEMPVLLSVIGRMKEAKAAAILAAMSPDKAREVTTQLALARTKAAASVRSSDPSPPVKSNTGKPPGTGT
jgi:flagellar motility protein MotE (MotC chaperone)